MNILTNMMEKTINMKYLKKFNENSNSEISYDFNDSNYDSESKSIVGAYMVIEDSDKSITILNLQEREDRKGIFADHAIPYTFDVFKIRLPKSQIEIIGEVMDKPGFTWIKIPYWLVRNNTGLKIQRIKNKKRFSNLISLHSKLDPKLIDSDVEKYLSIIDKDQRTLINLKSFMRSKK